MTENLRLTGSRTLKSYDSDVSSDWTLPVQNTGAWCTDYNDETCINTVNNLDSGDDTYGTYYSWAAATAGTGTYSITSGNASSSICPKGWRLPTGGSSGEFQTLYNNYNSSALMQDAPAFVLSGTRNGDIATGQGYSGYYSSSTARSSASAYDFVLRDSGVVLPTDASAKYIGFSVRCISR